MSLRFRVSAFACGCAAAMVVSLLASPARASTYTWDASGSSGTPSFDGSGTWSTTNANWWGNGADNDWTTASDTAVFGSGGSGPYTVTVPTSVSVGGIMFNPGSLYNISGGTIALYATTGAIAMNASAGTIGSVITGTAGLTMTGTGTLYLTGYNTYTGTTTLSSTSSSSSGVLSVGALNDTAFSNLPAGQQLTLNGGTLQYTGTGDTTNRAVVANANGATIQVVNPTADLILNGNLTTTTVNPNFTKTGLGTLTIGRNGSDNSGLDVSVAQGTLVLRKRIPRAAVPRRRSPTSAPALCCKWAPAAAAIAAERSGMASPI